MKLTKLALAAVALWGTTQAMAAGVTRLTGSSSSLINVVKGAQVMCATAKSLPAATLTAADFKVYITGSNGSSLGNFVTATCSADFDGTVVNVLALNVTGGSESAVTSSTWGFSSAVGAPPTPVAFLLPTARSCEILTASVASTYSSASVAAGQGFGALSFLPAGSLHRCGQAATGGYSVNAELATSDGGFMDVEGQFFPTTAVLEREDIGLIDRGAYVLAGFSQVFGVAVNKNLYEALQSLQYGSACTVGNTSTACQPSVTRADIAALISADVSSTGPKSQGAAIFGLGNVKLTYCMRPQTSGAQQATQLHFLDYDGIGKQGIVANNAIVGTKYKAIENAATGDVKTCLNTTAVTDFRFGILSSENNPIRGSDTYRFVKLNDVSLSQREIGSMATGDSQTTTAIVGKYDFVFDSVAFCNVGSDPVQGGSPGTCPDIITALTSSFPAGAASPGLISRFETKYGRNGSNATPFRRVKP